MTGPGPRPLSLTGIEAMSSTIRTMFINGGEEADIDEHGADGRGQGLDAGQAQLARGGFGHGAACSAASAASRPSRISMKLVAIDPYCVPEVSSSRTR